MHECPECGTAHEEPVVVVEAPEPAAEEVAEANVEIARIEADRDVKVARIEAGVAEDSFEARMVHLEGEIKGMREVLDRVAPPAVEEEQAPAPQSPVVVVDDQADEELPPKGEKHEPPKPSKRSTGFFGL